MYDMVVLISYLTSDVPLMLLDYPPQGAVGEDYRRAQKDLLSRGTRRRPLGMGAGQCRVQVQVPIDNYAVTIDAMTKFNCITGSRAPRAN